VWSPIRAPLPNPRPGDLATDLRVPVSIRGTATPGEDYAALRDAVIFPAGQSAVRWLVMANEDKLVEGEETVIAVLGAPASTETANYQLDRERTSATVVIHDSTRSAATVKITRPTSGAIFTAPAELEIAAVAVDPEGYIPRLELYANERLIGVSEITFIRAPDPGTPIEHSIVWQNPPAGDHVLTARGVDSSGEPVISEPVRITIRREPVVSLQVVLAIVTEDPVATEGSSEDIAVFRIKRVDGPRDIDVVAEVEIGGTARNGVDYQELPRTFRLPAGRESVEIPVRALADNIAEGEETVVLRLLEPVCIAIFPPPADCYLIARGQEAARVVIQDGETQGANLPPVVFLPSPRHGSVFTAGQNIEVRAEAADRDGTIARLSIFANGQLLAAAERGEVKAVWSNPPVGEHVLLARAVDNSGAESETKSVILVRPAERPFVTRDLPDSYSPGVALTVTLKAEPPVGTTAWVIEERVPLGWTVGAMSEGGTFQTEGRTVRFGRFEGARPQELSYVITPPQNASGRVEFAGVGSANGQATPIAGDRILASAESGTPAVRPDALRISEVLPVSPENSEKTLRLRVEGTAGQVGRLEVSRDLIEWVDAEQFFLPDGTVQLNETLGDTHERRFYRVRAD
jgi:hypothetical protein